MNEAAINSLSPFEENEKGKERVLNVVIDTPKGSRNKFKFDERLELFQLSKCLPLGSSFPFDFGFIPNTMGEDGDPIDVLVLMDEPAFVGCVVKARLIGNLAARQTEDDGKRVRNDRLIAVALAAPTYREWKTLDDLSPRLIAEIEHFFTAYNQMEGRQFRVTQHQSARRAWKVIESGSEKAAQK